MGFGAGAFSPGHWARHQRQVREARKIALGEAMQSKPARFKLSRGIRPDERFDTLQELALRIHAVRKGVAIQCTPGVNPRACTPNGPCVTIRYADTGELLGHAFLADPGPADVARLQRALRATEPKPDFLATLGEDLSDGAA